jgi:regulatory protein
VESPRRSKRKAELTPRGRALRLLARREHTRLELERKLAPHVEEAAELAALLDDLTSRGWLSEARAIEQLVHAKRARYGAARIRQLLLARGVSEDLIRPALAALKDTELESARAVWARKFREPARSAAERARQVRFLQARGFGIETAMRIVAGLDE